MEDYRRMALEIRKNSSPEELKQFVEALGGSIEADKAVKSVRSARPLKGLAGKLAAGAVAFGVVKSAVSAKHKIVRNTVRNLIGGVAAAGVVGSLASMKKKKEKEEPVKKCLLFGKYLCRCVEKEDKKTGKLPKHTGHAAGKVCRCLLRKKKEEKPGRIFGLFRR